MTQVMVLDSACAPLGKAWSVGHLSGLERPSLAADSVQAYRRLRATPIARRYNRSALVLRGRALHHTHPSLRKRGRVFILYKFYFPVPDTFFGQRGLTGCRFCDIFAVQIHPLLQGTERSAQQGSRSL